MNLETRKTMNKKFLILCAFCGLWASFARADNVNVTNPITRPVPVTSALVAGATRVPSTVKENSHVLKASAGSLISLIITSDSDQYILVMNSATVPSNGAVTLLMPPIHVGAASTTMVNFTVPLAASTGITVCNSNANSFTKTIGAADCIFTGQVK